LTEELQQCIANGDLEKEPRKTSSWPFQKSHTVETPEV
jgi:hypothetical protein